jgi:hypothetical protein
MDVALDDSTRLVSPLSTITSLPSLVQHLLALIHPTPLSFPPPARPSPHPPITSALSTIHISALEALNNIFLSLSTSSRPAFAADEASGQTIWLQLWLALGAVGTDAALGQEKRREMWDTAVGVLWGVGSVWKGSFVCVYLFWKVHKFNMAHTGFVVYSRLQPRSKSRC